MFLAIALVGCGGGGSTGTTATGGVPGETGGSGGGAPGTGGAPSTGGAPGTGGGTSDAGPPAPDAGDTPSALKIVEWAIPRAGNFPHDPAVDGKGVGWWTDQNNSYIGRWDPATGATMDWPTPTPACGPHGLTPDDQDNIWYTGQRCNKIGKLNPTTGMITEYAVGSDPHTPVFHKGALWFTVQSGSRYGRITASGMVETWATPSPASGPYGLWPAPDGTLWIALFATNKIAQLKPDAPATLRELPLPNAGSRPRRIAVDTAGHVYYTDYSRGYLGRYDPAANQFKEWMSPAGIGAQPYGITVGPDKRIYYCQSGADSIAVFDPATEKFQTIAIPTKGSVVRNMATDLTRRRIWLSLSGVGKMAYIDVP